MGVRVEEGLASLFSGLSVGGQQVRKVYSYPPADISGEDLPLVVIAPMGGRITLTPLAGVEVVSTYKGILVIAPVQAGAAFSEVVRGALPWRDALIRALLYGDWKMWGGEQVWVTPTEWGISLEELGSGHWVVLTFSFEVREFFSKED